MTYPAIQAVEIKPVSFPLKKPFCTAQGQKSKTDNVQVTLTLSNGVRGVAEASSSIAMPSQTQENMSRALQHLVPELRGKSIEDYKELISTVWRVEPLHPTATAAMECAILDAYCRILKRSLAAFLGGKTSSIESDLTFSVGAIPELTRQARLASKKGFRRFKVKLEGSPARDAERLKAVHRAVPKALLVADGNQGFSLSHAIEFAHRLRKDGIQLVFFEQPFPRHDLRAMRLFRQRTHVPVLADESIHTANDAIRLFEADAADGVNIKIAKSGILASLDMIRIAQRFRKRLAIGCMEESKLGLAASVHLACGTGAFEWADLDSVFLLASTPARGGFLIKGPTYSIKGIGPGIGM